MGDANRLINQESGVNLTLEKRIMRRVYAWWFLKSIAPLLAVEVILLLGVAIGVLAQISVKSIVINALNASSGARDFVQFFINNFFVKSMQSRLLVAVYGALAGFFVRDMASALKKIRLAAKDNYALFLAVVNPD